MRTWFLWSKQVALACVVAAIGLLPIAAIAGGASVQVQRMVVLVVPGLAPADLVSPQLPTLQKLTAEGGCGWMNVQTARTPGRRERVDPSAVCLTLGSGARASAVPEGASVEDARRVNARLDHAVSVGALGDLLRARGVRTVIVGNADGGAPDRSGRWICTDSSGRVDVDLSQPASCLERDDSARYGIRADLGAYRRAPADGFQVWVFGDVQRATRFAAGRGTSAGERSRALGRLDALLAMAAPQRVPGDELVVLAPMPAADAPALDRLVPFLWVGGEGAGVLASASTRTSGLILATDFLPWALSRFGCSVPRNAVGRSFAVVPHQGSTAQAWRAMHDLWLQHAVVQNTLGGAPVLLAILIMLAAVVLARSWSGGLTSIAYGVALVCLCAPLLQLVIPAVVPASVAAGGGTLGALCVCAIALGAFLGTRGRAYAAYCVCQGTAAILAVDLATGCRLQRTAWLSYSVMSGARFYGIGNEYVGVLCGASIVALGILRMRARRVMWAALYWVAVAVCVLVGAPFAGANAGGLLGFAAGLVVLGLVCWRGRLRAGDVAWGLLACVALMAAVLAIDLFRAGDQQSHIARSLVSGSGPVAIATRKAVLNGYLLLHSGWSLVLIAGVAGCVTLWWRLREIGAMDHVGVRGAVAGAVAGAAALLILNDSGVVCAALCVTTAWSAGVLCLGYVPDRAA